MLIMIITTSVVLDHHYVLYGSINPFSVPDYPCLGRRGLLEPVPAVKDARGGLHPGQVIQPPQGQLYVSLSHFYRTPRSAPNVLFASDMQIN